MTPLQSGFGKFSPPNPSMKLVVGIAVAMIALLACFALAFVALPSEGASSGTAPPTLTPTVTVTDLTPAATTSVTPMVDATSVPSDTIPSVTPMITVAPGITPTVASAPAVTAIAPTQLCGSVSGTAFFDINANGTYDPGEPGIASMAIQMQNTSGAVIAGTVSNGMGKYELKGMPLGSHVLRVAAPAGYMPTSPSEMAFNLLSCNDFPNLNFGFSQLATPPPPPPVPPTAPVAPTAAVPPTAVQPPTEAAPPPTNTFTPEPTLTLMPTETLTPVPTNTFTPSPTLVPPPLFFVTAAQGAIAWTDCPSIGFEGTITATGDGIVLYQWERSDGAIGQVQTLTFLSSGTLQVAQELVTFASQETRGWVRLKVLAPLQLNSEPVPFAMDCGVD